MASYRRRMLNFVAYWLQIQRIKRKNAVPTFDEIKAILDAKAKPYAWYDFARTDLTFQGATGQTLADDAGEVVALALSIDTNGAKTIAEVVASQPELVSNPGNPYAATTGYTGALGATLSVVSGKLRVTGNGATAFPYARIAIPTVVGKLYRVRAKGTKQSGGGTTQSIEKSDAVGNTNTSNSATTITTVEKTLFFIAAVTTTYLRLGSNGASDVIDWDYLSAVEIPGNHAVQTGAGTLRVVRQADKSCKGDGLDDNLLGTIMGAAAGNSLVALIEAPVTVASTQIIAGFNGASNGRFSLGVNAAGMLCAGVGANATTVHVTTFDVRGKTGVAALVEDGTNVKIYWDGNLIYTGARNGAPATTVPYRYWANNNNGTANAFFGGKIFKVIPIQHALNDNEIDWITANMKKVA